MGHKAEPMSSFETIIYEKHGALARITLNRPRVLNAYNIQMRDDLFEALTAVADDPDVRCLVFAGAGERAFCAGADLTEFGTAPSQVIARRVRWERDVWGVLTDLSVPTIAALHGYVLGSGLEIALCCDIRIASEDVKLGLPEASLGFIPAAGATQTLPRTVGIGQSLWMLLTTERLDAEKALDVGLVTEIVPTDQLMLRSEAIAKDLLRSPALALSSAKAAVHRGADLPLAQGLDMERRLASLLL